MYPDGKIPKNTVSENTTRYNAIRLDTKQYNKGENYRDLGGNGLHSRDPRSSE